MKRIAAAILSILFICSIMLTGVAEQSSGMPSMPDDMGQSSGLPSMPDGMEQSSGMPSMPDGAMPEGMQMPEGMTFDGDFGAFGSFSGFGGNVEGQLGSWSGGGTDASTLAGDDYAYDAALYITADGIDAAKSAQNRISGGTVNEAGADGIVLNDSEAGHNGILVTNASYTVSNAEINMITDADGKQTCDFSGKGTAIAAFGSEANVIVENSTIHTAGVATMPLFADEGATMTISNSTLQSDGGTLYAEYMNTPDQALMVAPPWILGIMGTSRALNIMGTGTTVNVVDSETSAGAWAVLSTDNGSNMALNVYNTAITLNNGDESKIAIQAEGGEISETLDNPYTENYGSGYGTFAIGGAVEVLAGSTLKVGTYATIFAGGDVTYTNMEKGTAYELKNAAGEVTTTYTAQEDKTTVIDSDTFGMVSHQGTNKVTVEKGTAINSGFATFLIKTGYSSQNTTASIDSAKIVNGGVLIQIMDNDDTTNGGMMSANDPENTNGGVQNFKPYHTEAAGFNAAEAAAANLVQSFSFTNGAYTGNIYNASGSDGLSGNVLNVTFGTGAEYQGAIASTAAIHVTYDGSMYVKANGGYAFDNANDAAAFAEKYQNTRFTIEEYWSIGQVANMVNSNGSNNVNVALNGNAVWQVTGTSLLTSLTITDNAAVVIPEGVTLTVGTTSYTGCTLTASSF